ncbi:lipopolysaccharide biosynthesis protein [Thermococcus sp. MAR1]|uniref:lipopolysaccharide biosynthesis protein n=1 Tax=Thermococcus sp. MAR1 TaxID=1638263 RepID=UPI001439C5F3|nr:lipopolysaccharide biosynthesis protein [Thermococcus sp. MAR1]NJE09689.1 lipopolysaccharide biosynthesis protein [Thermococcus sp. MAR1]
MSYERRVILRHSLASVIALALTGLTRFLYSVVIARRFGLEALGMANSLISKAFFVAIPLSFFAVALGKYASEFLGSEREDAIRSITLPSFLLPLAGLLLIPVNLYLGALATLRGIQLTLRNFLYGIHRGEHYAYIITLAFVGFLVGFLLPDIFAPYLLFLGLIAVFSVAYLARFDFVGKPRKSEMNLLLSYSSFAFLGTLSGVFLIQAPYFMSEYLSSPEVAGVVSAILSAAFLLTYLPQVLQSSIMPIFSYKYGRNEGDYVRLLAEKTTAFLILATGSAVFVLMILGREVLSAIFGFDVGPAFYLALMAVEIYITYNPSIVALNSTAYVKRGTFVALFGALVALLAWFYLIPAFGAIGVITGLVIGYTIILLGVAHYARALLDISPRIYSPLALVLLLQSLVFLSKYVLLAGFLLFLVYERGEIMEGIDLLKSFRGRGS